MAEPDKLRRLGSPQTPPQPLLRRCSWSPDVLRDVAWSNRRRNQRMRRRDDGALTDDDLEELRGCLDLGFRFDSPDLDPKLSATFPALGLYRAVCHRQYGGALFRSASCPAGAAVPVIDPVLEDQERMKTRLRQWAKVVACSVRQFSA
ncbi:Protein of unknown function (DUF1685 [Striga hermonthica]|uniref:Uncharacterized protein n=1 Tax=Striga hermonthica TaxID=68872 RepID=A0A9N7MIQ4_STRHE|nr:Protein of unknown function (DUF1685 [Striga hermonthica]